MNSARIASLAPARLLVPQAARWLLFFIVVVLMAISAGLAAASGSLFVTGIIGAALCGIFLVFAPVLLLWFVIVGSTIVAGLASLYLPEAGPLRWAFVIAAVFLGLAAIVRHLFEMMNMQRRATRLFEAVLFWALLYLFIVVVSSLFNGGLNFGSVVGLKNHFQVWGILFAFMFVPMTLRNVNAFLYYFLFLGSIQLVPVLHQYLVLTQQRVGLTQVDVVVGTFVGSMHGGGANALLAMVQVICVAILAGFWRRNRISGMSIIAASLFLLIPALLNEAKIVLVVLPLALGVVFWDYLRRNVTVLLLSAVLAIPVLAGMLWIQADIMREHNPRNNKDFESFVQSTVDYNIGDRGHGNYILNRTTVYPFWWSQHGLQNPLETIMGHGAASSKDSGAGLSERTLAKTRYPGYGIGLTGISALLWETGVLGLIAVIGLFVSAFRVAGRLADQYRETQTGMNMRAVQAGIAVFAASLFHNQSFVFELGYQTVLLFLFGYVSAVARLTFASDGNNAKKTDKGVDSQGIGVHGAALRKTS